MKDERHSRYRRSALLLFVGLALCGVTAGGALWFSQSSHVAERSRDQPHPDDDGPYFRGEAIGGLLPARPSVSSTRRETAAASSTLLRSSGADGAHPAGTRRVVESLVSLPPGLCADRDAAWNRTRAQYLATFVDVNVAEQGTHNARLLVAPGTLPHVLIRVGRELHSLAMSIQDSLGLPVEGPTIYLHPTVEKLHEYACVHASATAYYDGAIHLAPPEVDSRESELWPYKAIRHEYTHHVLMAAGVGEPFWFQEGVAMQMARDNPRVQDFPVEPFAAEQMIGALDHSDTEARVLQRYAQSSSMVGFLRAICRGTPLNEQAMVRALLDRLVEPGNLFDWAAHQCTQDMAEGASRLWAAYAQKRELDDTTRRHVWQRTPAQSAP